MTISIHKGSILDCDVDVIVNPANSFLMNGAGLAKVIENAATDSSGRAAPDATVAELREAVAPIEAYYEWKKHKKLIPYGGAVLSPPGGLHRKFKGIIHAVGPIWGGGRFYELELLYSVYWECVSIAQKAGFESIAFPAISAGIFGVPIDVVAEAAVKTARIAKLDVTFALMDDEHVAAFRKHLTA